VLPFGRLWYSDANAVANAIGYAQFYSRSHDAVIRVYDSGGNVIETHEHAGNFKEFDLLLNFLPRLFQNIRFSCYTGSNRKYNCKMDAVEFCA